MIEKSKMKNMPDAYFLNSGLPQVRKKLEEGKVRDFVGQGR